MGPAPLVGREAPRMDERNGEAAHGDGSHDANRETGGRASIGAATCTDCGARSRYAYPYRVSLSPNPTTDSAMTTVDSRLSAARARSVDLCRVRTNPRVSREPHRPCKQHRGHIPACDQQDSRADHRQHDHERTMHAVRRPARRSDRLELNSFGVGASEACAGLGTPNRAGANMVRPVLRETPRGRRTRSWTGTPNGGRTAPSSPPTAPQHPAGARPPLGRDPRRRIRGAQPR